MIADRFARLSTGIKMLIILSAALLPLGIIALSVSIDAANTNRFTREAAIRIIAADSSRRLDAGAMEVGRAMIGMANGLATIPAASNCRRALDELRMSQPPGIQFGLFSLDGTPVCTTLGFHIYPATPPPPGIGTEAALDQDTGLLRIIVARGPLLVIGEIPRPTLSRMVSLSSRVDPATLTLWQGDASLLLTAHGALASADRTTKIATPVVGGQLALELAANTVPMRATELLMVSLPILMWLAAGLIGWLVMNWLVLKPLARLQQAVSRYDTGDGPLHAPPMATPSQEIRSLAEAFSDATRRQAKHEEELAEGLVRQTRLTREVHHRVKNNLQVVSSLINLHARGARSDEARSAYGAIQRRVDALAVVHRNHYAELEENHGVGLRALIGELASNLRATASGEAATMAIRLELMPAAASQDVAVPVAFLVTEVAEMAMECAPKAGMTIRLRPAGSPDRALLELIAPGLADGACTAHPAIQRFNRVVEGLARQLRAPLIRDEASGYFAIEIPIVA